jgi:hypothetical protein
MAQYEIKDGKRVLVSRTKPAQARRTPPPRPAASTQATEPARTDDQAKSPAKGKGGKTTSREA